MTKPVQEPSLDPAILEQWIGNCQSVTDTIHASPANFLRATLDREHSVLGQGDALPPGYHWLYFLEAARLSELGRDGHPALGAFLPPVALPRRMWAGTRINFAGDILIGDSLEKVSTVKSIRRKSGRSGELCFVTVEHVISRRGETLIVEEHDIVYREEQSSGTGSPPVQAPIESAFEKPIEPTNVLLFRYSALTFNGHRIHYDLDYCRQIEGYPGLVVHAPLVATLMLDLADEYRLKQGEPRKIKAFRQKSVRPLYHPEPFSVNLRQANSGWDVWAADRQGNLASEASLELA